MAAGPIDGAFNEGPGLWLRQANWIFAVGGAPIHQPGDEWHGLVYRKVGQFDPSADVERRHPDVTDQVRRAGNAEQAERHVVETGLVRAPVVTLPNRGEEFVGGERQAAHGINLIQEDNQTPNRSSLRLTVTLHPLEDHVLQRGHPALERPQTVFVQPVIVQVVFQVAGGIELLAQPAEDAAIPLFGGEILANGGQVQHGYGHAFFS